MTTLNDWDDAPSVPTDPTLHAHKLGLHDDPDDDCPACRVDRGAALLDERRPGWWEDVDVDRLDIGACERCTLGQTFGHYSDGIVVLFDLATVHGQSTAHGFIWRNFDEIDRLTELWRSKINERKSNG